MADVLVSTETFNEYADNTALSVVWSQGTLTSGSSTVKDASPDGSQYIAIGGDSTSLGSPTMWGTNADLATHTYTGLTAGAQYRIRWKMNIGHSFSSVVGSYPAAHTFTAGLGANSDRYIIAVVDHHAPEGAREDEGIPVDAIRFDYPGINISGEHIKSADLFPSLTGWLNYELLTTADGSGHIAITFGTYDLRNFQANVYVDDLTVWLVPPPPPPTIIGPSFSGVQARGGACYLDSFLEYDGRNVASPTGLFPSVTVVLTGGTTWAAGETLTLTALGLVFVSGDVGNVLILHSEDDLTKVRFTITGFTSGTVVTGVANVAIPVTMQDTEITVWDKAVDQVAGLDHLEQEFVGIFADDHVVGSPNNARITLRQVMSGVVDLGDFYTHVFVGLSYLSDLETLDIDTPSGASMKGQHIDITRLGLLLMESRSLWGGSQPPTNDGADPLEGLREVPLPTDPDYETLMNGYVDENITSQWTDGGRVFVRSVDPVPLTVLAVIPHGYVPQAG
jgi:hypothetical protein